MDYLLLSLIAMALLGVHYFLVKVISPYVKGPTVIFLSGFIFIPTLLVYIYFTSTPFMPEPPVYLGYTFLIGMLLAAGILSLYIAIQRGPLSTVMPIYGLNTVITAALGVLVLQEALTPERVLGVIMAMGAIFLLSR